MLKNIPDLSFTIDNFTVKITKNSLTVTELNGYDLDFDYNFENNTLDFNSISNYSDGRVSWKASEDGLGGSANVNNARVMYSMGGGRFNLLGITDCRLI